VEARGQLDGGDDVVADGASPRRSCSRSDHWRRASRACGRFSVVKWSISQEPRRASTQDLGCAVLGQLTLLTEWPREAWSRNPYARSGLAGTPRRPRDPGYLPTGSFLDGLPYPHPSEARIFCAVGQHGAKGQLRRFGNLEPTWKNPLGETFGWGMKTLFRQG